MKVRDGAITYSVTLEPEDTPVKGNASAISPEVDADIERWIFEQLKQGNLGAWCCVKVTASIEVDDITFEGVAWLGCCSYASEEECERDALSNESGLKDEARADLVARLQTERTRAVSAEGALMMLGEKL